MSLKFKIGDRVRGYSCGAGSVVEGTISIVDPASKYPYAVDGVRIHELGIWCTPKGMELIEPKTYSKKTSLKAINKKAVHVYVLSKCAELEGYNSEEERILGVFLTREQGEEHKEKYERTFPNNSFSLLKFTLKASPKHNKKLLEALYGK